MLLRPAVLAMAMATTLIGAAYASSTTTSTPFVEPECPDGWSFGSECIEGNAMTACEAAAASAYPGCEVFCARCSSLGNYNCFMQQRQCDD